MSDGLSIGSVDIGFAKESVKAASQLIDSAIGNDLLSQAVGLSLGGKSGISLQSSYSGNFSEAAGLKGPSVKASISASARKGFSSDGASSRIGFDSSGASAIDHTQAKGGHHVKGVDPFELVQSLVDSAQNQEKTPSQIFASLI